MSTFHKRLLLLIIFIGGISGLVLYFTVDMHTLKHLDIFRPWSLGAALLSLAVGMYFDGTRLMHLVRVAGEKISLLQAVQVIFSNYFLALLTPGAAGGAVAQVLFLRRAGVPTGKATVLVLIRTLLSVLFLFMCLPFVFYYDTALMPWIPANVLIGAAIAVIVGAFGGIFLLRSGWTDRVVVMLVRKIRTKFGRGLLRLYRDIREAILLLSDKPVAMVRVFFETVLSLLALYAMVPALFMGLGIEVDWPLVMGRMIILNALLYFAPTPGGSGIAEGGFVLLFNAMLPPGTVGILAVAWRVFAEYLPFSIGFYYTINVFGRDFLSKQIK
jgi:hypothetical protein